MGGCQRTGWRPARYPAVTRLLGYPTPALDDRPSLARYIGHPLTPERFLAETPILA
jgi:hypothetical protein